MNLKLTKHFQVRMLMRGISIDHVKKAVREPDEKENAYEGKIRVRKEIEGKTIEVIYCQEMFRDKKAEYLIITAYYL
ncbi:MAG: DUF4258 domain-containing protein [bacterium]|nr:DUF4258 domain-containing protein [bacterium]